MSHPRMGLDRLRKILSNRQRTVGFSFNTSYFLLYVCVSEQKTRPRTRDTYGCCEPTNIGGGHRSCVRAPIKPGFTI